MNSLSQSIPSRHRESREQSRKCSLSTLDSLRPQFNLNIFVVSHLLNPASREILEEFIWRIELISSSLEIPFLSCIAASVDRLRDRVRRRWPSCEVVATSKHLDLLRAGRMGVECHASNYFVVVVRKATEPPAHELWWRLLCWSDQVIRFSCCVSVGQSTSLASHLPDPLRTKCVCRRRKSERN